MRLQASDAWSKCVCKSSPINLFAEGSVLRDFGQKLSIMNNSNNKKKKKLYYYYYYVLSLKLC